MLRGGRSRSLSGGNMLKLVEKYARGVFQAEEIAILVAAFDDCWIRLQESGAQYGSEYSMARAQQQLARSIIEAAKRGERDPRRLCDDAFLHMSKANLMEPPE